MMKTNDSLMVAADFAYNIIDLVEEVLFLRQEVAELKDYERKYRELLAKSIQTSENNAALLVKAALAGVFKSPKGR